MKDYVRAFVRGVGAVIMAIGALVGAATVGAAWGQAHPNPPEERRPAK